MPVNYYAHSLEGKPPEEWHSLEDHLRVLLNLRPSLPTSSAARNEDVVFIDVPEGVRPNDLIRRDRNFRGTRQEDQQTAEEGKTSEKCR